MLIFELRNAQSCTDLNLYLYKFPGGNTPGPQNWGGGKPTSPRCARPPPAPLILSFRIRRRPLPPIRSPNMQRDFYQPQLYFLVLLVLLSLTPSFQSALKSKTHVKSHKIAYKTSRKRFRLELRPRHRWGSLRCSSRPPSRLRI